MTRLSVNDQMDSDINIVSNTINKNWKIINQLEDEKYLRFSSKKLVIYSYSFSKNLLKELLLQMRIKFLITNDITKASLIIGLKKHFKQNPKLINLAKQKKIPIYMLNQLSFYQLVNLFQFLNKN